MSNHNMEQEIPPENPTPFYEYTPLPSGTRETPILTHITAGQRSKARIFHTKENGPFLILIKLTKISSNK